MAESGERVVVPEDAQGRWTTEDAEDFYIPTYDVAQYRSWDQSDGAAQMYGRALRSCWASE